MFTMAEAGAELRVSARTVRRLVRDGRLRAVRVTDGPSGIIRIDAQAIRDYLDANTRGGSPADPTTTAA